MRRMIAARVSNRKCWWQELRRLATCEREELWSDEEIASHDLDSGDISELAAQVTHTDHNTPPTSIILCLLSNTYSKQ